MSIQVCFTFFELCPGVLLKVRSKDSKGLAQKVFHNIPTSSVEKFHGVLPLDLKSSAPLLKFGLVPFGLLWKDRLQGLTTGAHGVATWHGGIPGLGDRC